MIITYEYTFEYFACCKVHYVIFTYSTCLIFIPSLSSNMIFILLDKEAINAFKHLSKLKPIFILYIL